MATTEILQFAGGGGANVLTQADYAALTSLLANGFQSGEVHSEQFNKVIRQANFMAVGLAQFVVNTGISVPDDADVSALAVNIANAIVTAAGGGVTFASNAQAQAMSSTNTIISPATLKTANQGGNQDLSSNGYQKIPGGLIFQWGSSGPVSPDSNNTLSFPLAFPTSCIKVIAFMRNASTSNDDVCARTMSYSQTQCELRAEYTGSVTSGTRYIEYFAIGK